MKYVTPGRAEMEDRNDVTDVKMRKQRHLQLENSN